MKQTRWLYEFSSLSEYTRLYPNESLQFRNIMNNRNMTATFVTMLTFIKVNISKNAFRNTIRVSNELDPEKVVICVFAKVISRETSL